MTRVAEIRAHLDRASRAFSWLGAAGIARDEVVYLLNVADAAEGIVELVKREGSIVRVDGLELLAQLERIQTALDRAPSSAGAGAVSSPATGGARSGTWRRSRPW